MANSKNVTPTTTKSTKKSTKKTRSAKTDALKGGKPGPKRGRGGETWPKGPKLVFLDDNLDLGGGEPGSLGWFKELSTLDQLPGLV
ncbi:hypothetical protein AAF712_012212 [Marasmius tenuissimus]|uniref:Uncharacterized protein n=1 Tax=Marasmius tenuissimus TaxID=585030 RepID=A0ABR2ZH26_9AGAR